MENFIFCAVGFGSKIGGRVVQDLSVHMTLSVRKIDMWLKSYGFAFQVITEAKILPVIW